MPDTDQERLDPLREPGKVMMQYGALDTIFAKTKRFDATKWFKNGTYRLWRGLWNEDVFDEIIMLRMSVPPVPDSELDDLRAALVVGISPEMLELRGNLFNYQAPPPPYERTLMSDDFDPRSQLIYEQSYFDKMDVPFAGLLANHFPRSL